MSYDRIEPEDMMPLEKLDPYTKSRVVVLTFMFALLIIAAAGFVFGAIVGMSGVWFFAVTVFIVANLVIGAIITTQLNAHRVAIKEAAHETTPEEES